MSRSAIERITGLHRGTVSRWLEVRPAATPAAVPEDSARTDTALPDDPVPPAPWTGREQVWRVREALKGHRWLLLRRPDHLRAEQQRTVTGRATGPLEDLLGVARRFLLDWYVLWRTEDGQRRSLAEAQERYERWRTNPDYQAMLPCARCKV